MTGTQAIKTSLEATSWLFTNSLTDLSDADLLVRPVPESNHIAWQIGHLVVSEQGIVLAQLPDANFPALTAGFKEAHAQEKHASDTGFATKAEYLDLFTKTRAATLAALAGLTDADLDKPSGGRMAAFAPNVGACFVLVCSHTMMHGGQFSVVRRKLGKPVLM